MDEDWNALENVRSYTGVVSDHRQAPSQISQKFAGLIAQTTHRFHGDWYASMDGSNARILDMLVPGLFVPWTIRTLDYSYYRWTIRTLDCSYRGLFVPSFIVRTMDYSYHHWMIRTVMQDSQKLTFPTKMCLCSVWVNPPPEFFWHFPQTFRTF